MSNEVETSPFSTFVAQQVTAGVRGFVIGEDHRTVNLPNKLAQDMANFKKAGVATLFVEHVPAERQAMLNEALAGKPAAQRELYMHMLGHWYNDAAATARYDMMFAAHAAGLNVVGIDTATRNLHLMMNSEGEVGQQRLTMGDAYMAREIIRQHKDQPFMVLAGIAHVARDGSDVGPLKASAHGSIDKRLTAAGINTIAVWTQGYFPEVPDFAVLYPREVDNVYQLSILDPAGDDSAPNNRYASASAKHGYMRDNFKQMAQDGRAGVNPKAFKTIQKQLDVVSAAFNTCTEPNRLMQMYKPLEAAAGGIGPTKAGDNKLGDFMQSNLKSMSALLGSDDAATDRAELCKPGAEAKWLRPVGKPQGSTP